jgi:hypothetical protein
MRATSFRKFIMLLAGSLVGCAAGAAQAETARLPSAEAYINAEESHWLVRGQEESSPVVFDLANATSGTSATLGDGGAGCGCGDNKCDGGCGDRCGFPSGGAGAECCRRGWFGGAELVFLKPFQSEVTNNNDFNYRPGFRGWFGIQREDGLGVRLSAFDYFQRSGVAATTAPARQVLDINNLDAEVVDSFNICNWNVMVGGGVRYLSFREDWHTGGLAFHGVGPVVSAQITRAVNENWSLYGITRESMVFGRTIAHAANDIDEDVSAFIAEIQLGLQYNRPLANGGIGFARLGWEAQHYSGIDDHDTQDLSLVGGVMSIGLMR